MATLAVKKADLAGPGIGDYTELEKILPSDYHSLLTPRETQRAIFAAKNYIEEHLCKELNLMMVTVPLIVDVESSSTTCSTAMARALPSSSTAVTS
jgi:aspartate--ammonia ligase